MDGQKLMLSNNNIYSMTYVGKDNIPFEIKDNNIKWVVFYCFTWLHSIYVVIHLTLVLWGFYSLFFKFYVLCFMFKWKIIKFIFWNSRKIKTRIYRHWKKKRIHPCRIFNPIYVLVGNLLFMLYVLFMFLYLFVCHYRQWKSLEIIKS